MKRSSKPLKGHKEISESDELLANLPPGSQISPGPQGGTFIFIPNPGGFSSQVPDFRGPWATIRKEIYRFEVLAGCDGKTLIPRSKTPLKGIDARCDQWIKEFYQDKDKNRWDRSVPKEIAPWLVARTMMAGTFVAMEDTHGMKPERRNLDEYMCHLLIDFWHAGGKDFWHGVHPDASSHSE